MLKTRLINIVTIITHLIKKSWPFCVVIKHMQSMFITNYIEGGGKCFLSPIPTLKYKTCIILLNCYQQIP